MYCTTQEQACQDRTKKIRQNRPNLTGPSKPDQTGYQARQDKTNHTNSQ